MRKIGELLERMTGMAGDMERTEAGWDAAEKKGNDITVYGRGGTVWIMCLIRSRWYWERDRLAAHPADRETERIIEELCGGRLYG